MIKLFNTLSGKKEIFKPRKNKKVNMFVCGPTVYDYPHIGHARTYLIFDAFAKYLKFSGYKVKYLQNITDIDDKIIDRAKKNLISSKDLAKKFEKIYREDEKKINISSISNHARATNHIPQIIKQIKTLIKKQYAYFIADDGWYFDISKFKDYGKLSKRTALQAQDAISRIDESVSKKNKGDFALWKLSKAGEPSWSFAFAQDGSAVQMNGRPGWHIEDTAITEHYFGSQYDIHGGAVDLKFPHHEAEIAQQESASGKKPLVKIWMHTGFLLVNGKKMSKSLGNFITIRDFLNKYPKEVLRFLVFSTHYRTPINYTEKLAKQAEKNIQTIFEWREKILKQKFQLSEIRSPKVEILKIKEKFFQYLANDFNTPKAFAVIFNLIKKTNQLMAKNELDGKTADEIKKFFLEIDKIFAILPKKEKNIIPQEIIILAQKRELLRKEKKWQDADQIREKIKKLGYLVEDTKKGPLIKIRK